MTERPPMPAPRGDSFVLRGGLLITLDDRLGELTGDILVAGGKIKDVAPRSSGDIEIVDAADYLVLPGLVDPHRHTWQSPIRHTGLDWDLPRMFVRAVQALRPELPARGCLCRDAVRPARRARRRRHHAARLGAHPELARSRR